MKAREALKSSVLSFLRAEMINVAGAKKKNTLDDAETITVIKKQMKQRQDSIEQFTKGNRLEMAEKEKQAVVADRRMPMMVLASPVVVGAVSVTLPLSVPSAT